MASSVAAWCDLQGTEGKHDGWMATRKDTALWRGMRPIRGSRFINTSVLLPLDGCRDLMNYGRWLSWALKQLEISSLPYLLCFRFEKIFRNRHSDYFEGFRRSRNDGLVIWRPCSNKMELSFKSFLILLLSLMCLWGPCIPSLDPSKGGLMILIQRLAFVKKLLCLNPIGNYRAELSGSRREVTMWRVLY